jgi:hypothetical protein
VPGMFCSTVVGSLVVCLVCWAVLLLAVLYCARCVLHYCCWRCDSVSGIFCSTVLDGVVVCLVCCAVLLLAVW